MQSTNKITIILIAVIAIVMCTNATVFAVIDTNKYDPSKITPISSEESEMTGRVVGKILGTIKVIGICIAVIMLTIIGLKYIISSVDEKANYKENMIPYIVGCFLLASATTIPSIVYDLVNK